MSGIIITPKKYTLNIFIVLVIFVFLLYYSEEKEFVSICV